MKVSNKLLVVIGITIAAAATGYAALKFAQAPAEVFLIAGVAAVLIQFMIAMQYSKQLEADRDEALKIAGRICKKEVSLQNDQSFSVVLDDIEELFRDTLRRERKVVENAADVICLISTEGIILSANPAAKSVFGYTPEDLLGKKLSDFLVTEEAGDSLNPLLGGDESIQKISLETRFKKKGGSLIDILWSAHWSATDKALFCIAHDITERKRAEQLLKESEERVRHILASLPAGVCVLGLAGQVLFINKMARQIFSIGDQAWNGQAKGMFLPCADPFKIDPFIETISAAAEPKILNMNSEEIPVELSVRKMDWEEKPACLVMFVDASEKQAAEKAKQQFIAMRQKLMDMVVHDIRGPLASLQSSQELILKGIGCTVDDKAKAKLEICQDETKRVIRLLNDLLRISRHEATRLNLVLAEAQSEELIAKAVSSINDLAQEKSLTIKTDLVASKINVDSDRIMQVVYNLLSNAIKFSPRDKTISVKSQIWGSALKVSVSDEGEGIPAGAEDSLFQPYSQLSWRDSAEKGGTGLGLSICREIVEEHGGTIGVANNPGGGANFWFTIPSA